MNLLAQLDPIAPLPVQPLAIAVVLLAAGMWLALPRGLSRGRRLGAVAALAGLATLGAQLPPLAGWLNQSVFSVLALVTVGSAACAVSFRSPVYSAIWFALTLVGVAGLFLYSGAQFLALATLAVYAGAIVVTFLFVLMLAQPTGRDTYDSVSWEAFLSASLGALVIGAMTWTTFHTLSDARVLGEPPSAEALGGDVLAANHMARLGGTLFSEHLIAVELAGLLLLVALIGAAAVAARQRADQPVSQGHDSAPSRESAGG